MFDLPPVVQMAAKMQPPHTKDQVNFKAGNWNFAAFCIKVLHDSIQGVIIKEIISKISQPFILKVHTNHPKIQFRKKEVL